MTGTTTRSTDPAGTLEHLDPHAIHLGNNVRDDAALNTQFLASVREHGVLQPITAIRTADGVEIRDGQRRTLAARHAGLATIPVYVLTTSEDTETAAAERITQQIDTNDHRAALTDAQRAKDGQLHPCRHRPHRPHRVAMALRRHQDHVDTSTTQQHFRRLLSSPTSRRDRRPLTRSKNRRQSCATGRWLPCPH
jgi:ParB-like nuclease domain